MPTPTLDRAALVAVGDHVVLALILAWGYVSHHGVGGLVNVPDLLLTVGPFLLGYLLATALVAAYDEPDVADLAVGLRTAATAWLAATGIGLVARTSPLVEGGAAWPFGLVLLGTGLSGLLGWRLVVHLAWRRFASGPQRRQRRSR